MKRESTPRTPAGWTKVRGPTNDASRPAFTKVIAGRSHYRISPDILDMPDELAGWVLTAWGLRGRPAIVGIARDGTEVGKRSPAAGGYSTPSDAAGSAATHQRTSTTRIAAPQRRNPKSATTVYRRASDMSKDPRAQELISYIMNSESERFGNLVKELKRELMYYKRYDHAEGVHAWKYLAEKSASRHNHYYDPKFTDADVSEAGTALANAFEDDYGYGDSSVRYYTVEDLEEMPNLPDDRPYPSKPTDNNGCLVKVDTGSFRVVLCWGYGLKGSEAGYMVRVNGKWESSTPAGRLSNFW